MSQLVSRRSLLVCIGALAAAVLLVVVFATNGAAPGMATPQAESIDGAGGTLPVGSALPSAAQCTAYAEQVGSHREAVPENTAANLSVPGHLKLPPWPDSTWDPSVNRLFVPRIDGQYTGTTDQIIVWGACKWGISPDVVRAMAMQESSWRQSTVSDYVNDPALCVGGYSVPCPTSFGLLGLKHIYRPGSWPDSQQHTAFNVDYGLAVIRGCFEGWLTYLGNGYTPGDLSGCLGWHFSGSSWKNDLALGYIQRVQGRLDDQPWTRW
ncbi:MAG: hypothetical protein JWR37_5639 [Mycobacterium sp.]|nr:hypothetical protein [Mycobacterium sp.]